MMSLPVKEAPWARPTHGHTFVVLDITPQQRALCEIHITTIESATQGLKSSSSGFEEDRNISYFDDFSLPLKLLFSCFYRKNSISNVAERSRSRSKATLSDD
jgi:hypothetical protein